MELEPFIFAMVLLDLSQNVGANLNKGFMGASQKAKMYLEYVAGLGFAAKCVLWIISFFLTDWKIVLAALAVSMVLYVIRPRNFFFNLVLVWLFPILMTATIVLMLIQ